MAVAQNKLFSNTKLYPITFVLKYDPPMIGMVYKIKETDQKKRIYKIYLHGLIYKNDAEAITHQLFQEHALHINEANVSHNQIKDLVVKLLSSRGGKADTQKKGAGAQKLGNLPALNAGKANQGINIQDFGQAKGKQQMNKYAYGGEEEEYEGRDIGNEQLEFEGEIDDLEHDDFEYEEYENAAASQQKSGSKKMDFLRNLANNRGNKEEAMDYIMDDPNNLESLSDY